MSKPYQSQSALVRWYPTDGRVVRGIKLDAKQVGRLRRAYKLGAERLDLAGRFGVSYMTVGLIINRKTWKTVP